MTTGLGVPILPTANVQQQVPVTQVTYGTPQFAFTNFAQPNQLLQPNQVYQQQIGGFQNNFAGLTIGMPVNLLAHPLWLLHRMLP